MRKDSDSTNPIIVGVNGLKSGYFHRVVETGENIKILWLRHRFDFGRLLHIPDKRTTTKASNISRAVCQAADQTLRLEGNKQNNLTTVHLHLGHAPAFSPSIWSQSTQSGSAFTAQSSGESWLAPTYLPFFGVGGRKGLIILLGKAFERVIQPQSTPPLHPCASSN